LTFYEPPTKEKTMLLQTLFASAPIKEFVTVTKLHPILVDFTAALIPVSVAADLLSQLLKLKHNEFRIVAWWTLLLATIITPFTVAAGWLFWMPDDNGVPIMTVHKWLGTALALLIFGLCYWRWTFRNKRQPVNIFYLIAATLF